VATLEESAGGSGVLLRGYTDAPDWLARLLASLGCRLEVRQPPELRDALRRHAAQIALWAEG
jgi:predicted DNA-binding transcriptional regulator YafY